MPEIDQDTLTALISKVQSLSDEQTNLKGQLSSVTAELQALRKEKDTGVATTFPSFKKLPLELQRMIWTWALTGIPQLHVLGEDLCSKSNVNSVAWSCSDAWKIFKELDFDYLDIELSANYSGSPWDRPPRRYTKSYVNLEIDTFWLFGPSGEEQNFPAAVNAHCGKCVKKSGPVPHYEYREYCGYMTLCPRIEYQSFFPIQRMIINSESWCDPGEAAYFWNGTLDILFLCKVQELLIVIASDVSKTTVWPNPHTKLVDANPYFARGTEYRQLYEESGRFMGAVGKNWCELANNLMKKLQEFKDERARERQRYINDSVLMPPATLENTLNDQSLYDMSEWQIPRVRFVQAMPEVGQWVVPYYSNR